MGANQTRSDGAVVGADVDVGKGVSVGLGGFVGRWVSGELQLTAARQTIIAAIHHGFEYAFTVDILGKISCIIFTNR